MFVSRIDYDDACTMFSFLQNSLKGSEMKLPHASDIIFLGSPYSENDFTC